MIRDLYRKYVATRLNRYKPPPRELADILRDNVMPVAPFGMKHVHLNGGSTTQANEAALTAALQKYARDHKLSDVSNLCVLGFENGYHGNSQNSLSSSDQVTNVQRTSVLDWPLAPFP